MLRFPSYMSSSMLLATLNFFLFIMLHIRCPVFGLILRLLPYALACFSSCANVYGIFHHSYFRATALLERVAPMPGDECFTRARARENSPSLRPSISTFMSTEKYSFPL